MIGRRYATLIEPRMKGVRPCSLGYNAWLLADFAVAGVVAGFCRRASPGNID